MIQVNNRPVDWFEGMTITSLFHQMNYTYSDIIVKVNGVFIPKEKYSETFIRDNDDVLALHMFGGG